MYCIVVHFKYCIVEISTLGIRVSDMDRADSMILTFYMTPLGQWHWLAGKDYMIQGSTIRSGFEIVLKIKSCFMHDFSCN